MHIEVGQAGVEGAPAHSAIGALEYAASISAAQGLGPRVDRSRRYGVDGQGVHTTWAAQAGVDVAPTPPTISALSYAVLATRVQRGRRHGVDGQGLPNRVDTQEDPAPAPPTIS